MATTKPDTCRESKTENAEIKSKHPSSTIVVIDAALGRPERVGTISVNKGPLKPARCR